MQRAEAIQERAAVEGLTKMGCTHGAPSNASLELGPPFWRCAMVGVHPRRPVQRKPGTRTLFLALRYGWVAPTAPRPTQAWNSDQPSLVWSDLHEPKKKIGRKTKKGTGAHRYPVLYVVHMYVSSARLMLIKTKPYHPHLAYCPVRVGPNRISSQLPVSDWSFWEPRNPLWSEPDWLARRMLLRLISRFA